MSKFLGLDKWLINNISNLQYSKPTPIQELAIPEILKGHDVIGIAKTGTGKTASFCLPILNKLASDPSGIYCIILEPTRELAVQVVEKLKVFSNGFNLRISTIIGGINFTEQMHNLDHIPHIIVATPGRLAYLLEESYSQFEYIENLKYLVLDEFDQLLNDTIIKDIDTILKYLPNDRNTLLFSATIGKEHSLEYFKKYQVKQQVMINVCGEEEQRLLNQMYTLVPNKMKENYLLYLLQGELKKKYMIIFVPSCKECHYLTNLLELFKLKVSPIHSKMPQRKRLESLDKFKSKINNILLATDLASRGLDIPNVDLVINYNVPRVPDIYIHRIGRTARAGRKGESISFITQYDVELVLAIEEVIKEKLVEYPIDKELVIEDLTIVSKGIKLVKMKLCENGFYDKIEKIK